MRELPLNIIDFIRHPDVLNDQSLSKAQQAWHKTLYGLPLDETELEIHHRCTGRDAYVPREYREMSGIAGRRSGKTSRIAAPIACFEAFRDHGLPRGEKAYVLLIAPTRDLARIAFHFIQRYISSSPILSKRVVKILKNEIELSNGITIACFPCSYVAVRGITVVAAICDEMAFWRHEETAANPEQEILDALRPSMATVVRAKLIRVSTPFRKEGVLWTEYQRRAELDFPVWVAPTSEMNPAIPPAVLERERKRDEQKFRREFKAEFVENTTSWIESEILESCIVQGRRDLPRVADGLYVAAIDPGFVRSDFALAIAHLSPDGAIVLDRVARWCGTKKAPLGFEWVCQEIKRILDQYSIDSAIGDQYCAPVIRQQLLKLGVYYEDFAFGSHTRAEIFGNLRHLLEQGKIDLLDDLELLRQLRSLEEQKTDRGQIDVRPRGGMRDDLAVAVALAASQLAKRSSASLFQLGIVEHHIHPRLNVIPASCPFQAICANFPRCLDEGSCQDFKDERVNP